MDEHLDEILSILAVFILISLSTALYLRYFYRLKDTIGTLPFFERSEHLLIMALIFNYFETVLNLFEGATYYILRFEKHYFHLFFILSATFCTRFYASCMGLRIYRLKELYALRSPNMQRFSRFGTSTLKNFVVIPLFYSSLATITTLFFDFYSTVFLSGLFTKTCYLSESLCFFVLSYRYFSYAKHPSIPVEYIFYALIWVSGISNSGKNRCIYEIPLRNSLLLFISILSVHSHSSVLRPPLPTEIEFRNVFDIKELYYDFFDYLGKNADKSEVEACRVLKDLEVVGEFSSETAKSIMMISSNSYLSEFVQQGESINENVYSEIKESLESKLEAGFEAYLKSNELKAFKKNYFVNFN